MKLTGIRVLLWDVDGTLARSPQLMPAIHDAQKRVIAKELGVSIEEATRLWLEHRPKFSSTTQLTAFIIHKNPVETDIMVEKIAKKWQVTPHDEKLVAMFTHLSQFTHYICGNGTVHGIGAQLKALGLAPAIFKKIFAVDTAGFPKPNPAMFRMALTDSGLAPADHLMIGDRVDVDILPTKALGMQTCLVGSESAEADVCIPTVYDVVNVLI